MIANGLSGYSSCMIDITTKRIVRFGGRRVLKRDSKHWKSFAALVRNSFLACILMKTSQDFEEFFASLNNNEVRYVVVGAYAFALHAYPRYTGDLDILIVPDRENARKAVAALEQFGVESLGLTELDFLTPGRVIQIGFPPLRIDLLTSIDGVDAKEAWERRVTSSYGKETVSFLSKKDLIRNKSASGRPKDSQDLKDLTS